ncbi:MAG: 30S ribosomal protein S4 [Bacteroidota bacterium]|nr:30S ribosomal protein S4 [Bacteroidota bacterium]GIR59064.1 MAG: 30S ribosomal protein S4 [Crocinitomicaceae bacterium]MEC7083886.1 30S ribosomal protein S4 [Bacteroidota bacterium]MEC7618545.1 30S ribosomal protein S4 [Bacteroidota bacterium]MEC7814022.1 30S ribosomal protein S4 [Bacteroidota bacterium]|tara:strand:- start:771 stop:1376 length:606 start_codon:yes stop_codon:yes gene_type:complete
MARYKGPKSKIARKFREPIFGPDKALEKKNYPPGVHGPNKRRMKRSEYAIQLAEKQKAKYTYGILERQFSNMFKKASSKSGITGEILLQLCEMRLDNVVFRLGISPSRRGARQLVTHRHITVNGKIVNIPSYSLRVGDVVGVREKSKSLQVVTASLNSDHNVTEWLLWDSSAMSGEVKAEPTREQITENIKEQLIVELYSK